MVEQRLEELIRGLSASDGSERLFVVQDLGHSRSERAIKPLLDCLRRESQTVVKEAIRTAILQISSASWPTEIVDLLYSDSAFERDLAVQVLRRRGAEDDPFLWKIFSSDQDANIRKLVMDIVLEFAPQRLAPFIRSALRDDNPNVVMAAIEGIALSGMAEFKDDLESLFGQAREPMLISACLEALLRVGDSNSLRMVLGTNGTLRDVPRPSLLAVLKLYGAFAEPPAIAELESFSRENPFWRQTIFLYSILPIFLKNQLMPVSEHLLETIRGEVGKIRNEREQALVFSFLDSRIEEPPVRELLFDFLDDPDPGIRQSALYVCANASGEDVRERLLDRLKNEPLPLLKEIIENVLR